MDKIVVTGTEDILDTVAKEIMIMVDNGVIIILHIGADKQNKTKDNL